MQKKVGRIVLGMCLLVGLVNLVVQARSLTSLSHDSAISLIAASGHQAAYATQAPAQRWTTAAEWQRLWSLERLGDFGTIRAGLAQYDIHPPLYFWLLHLWLHGVGVQLSAGMWLNVIWHIFTAVGIWAACRRLQLDHYYAMFAGVLWVVNAAIQMSLSEARQYSLLGLLVILHFLATLAWLRAPGRDKPLALLALATVAGLSTHYYFALYLVAVGLWQVVHLLGTRRTDRCLRLLLAYGLAVAVFVLVNPGFLSAFGRQQTQALPFAWSLSAFRFTVFLMGLLHIFLPAAWVYAPPFVIGLLLAGISFLVYRLWRKQPLGPWPTWTYQEPHELVSFCLALLTILALLLFVGGISPLHAIGPKYLMFLLPLVFVGLAQLLSRWGHTHQRWAWYVSIGLLAIQVGAGLAYSVNSVTAHHQPILPGDFNSGQPILLDTTRRGILPVVLFAVSPQTPVLATDQPFLLAQPQLIERYDCLYYVSSTWYENDLAQRERILANWSHRGYQHHRQDHWQYDKAEIFLLWRSAEGTPPDISTCPGG